MNNPILLLGWYHCNGRLLTSAAISEDSAVHLVQDRVQPQLTDLCWERTHILDIPSISEKWLQYPLGIDSVDNYNLCSDCCRDRRDGALEPIPGLVLSVLTFLKVAGDNSTSSNFVSDWLGWHCPMTGYLVKRIFLFISHVWVRIEKIESK